MDEKRISVIKEKICKDRLRSFLNNPFPEMIKFVVDIHEEIIALGGELHSDAEQILLEENSKHINLWGGNIYPDASVENRIEYSALINIRPSQNNRSMEIENQLIKDKINMIAEKLIAFE